MKLPVALLLALALCCGIVSAAPTAGVATDITSNGFNTTITGVVGADAWIYWGDQPGFENWITPNFTATGGTAQAQVIGAPIFGGEIVYYQACDNTGCGAEQTVTILAITPMPTQTIDQFLTNITRSRFNPAVISQSIFSAATIIVPQSVFVGLSALVFVLGLWTRTKSTRLAVVLGLLIFPLIYKSTEGFYLGLPSTGIDLSIAFLCAALAGIIVTFMRK
jgi:hypothetical protein